MIVEVNRGRVARVVVVADGVARADAVFVEVVRRDDRYSLGMSVRQAGLAAWVRDNPQAGAKCVLDVLSACLPPSFWRRVAAMLAGR